MCARLPCDRMSATSPSADSTLSQRREAAVGGPIALVQNGDEIFVDSVTRVIEMPNVSEEEMQARRAKWVPPKLKHDRGVLYRYARVREHRCELLQHDGG